MMVCREKACGSSWSGLNGFHCPRGQCSPFYVSCQTPSLIYVTQPWILCFEISWVSRYWEDSFFLSWPCQRPPFFLCWLNFYHRLKDFFCEGYWALWLCGENRCKSSAINLDTPCAPVVFGFIEDAGWDAAVECRDLRNLCNIGILRSGHLFISINPGRAGLMEWDGEGAEYSKNLIPRPWQEVQVDTSWWQVLCAASCERPDMSLYSSDLHCTDIKEFQWAGVVYNINWIHAPRMEEIQT